MLIHGALTDPKAEHWNEAVKEYGINQQHVAGYPMINQKLWKFTMFNL